MATFFFRLPIMHRSFACGITRAFQLLCLLSLVVACSTHKTIVNGIDEKEANEIVVFLASKGITANKVQQASSGGGGGSKVILWDISVDEKDTTEAMAILNQSGLPRRRGQNLLGIFANTGLVPSELQEKIRYQAGLAEQIASTIRKIDGVLDAEVQISFPEEDPLTPAAEKKGKITASVYVKHSGVLDDPNSHLVTKIKRLVAASITGLNFDDVTVISDRARFSDVSGAVVRDFDTEETEFVSIWSILVAKESATRFRILFFSFSIAILLLLLSSIWLVWKTLPLLNQCGGIKRLLDLHPLSVVSGQAELSPSEPEPADEAKTVADEEEGIT